WASVPPKHFVMAALSSPVVMGWPCSRDGRRRAAASRIAVARSASVDAGAGTRVACLAAADAVVTMFMGDPSRAGGSDPPTRSLCSGRAAPFPAPLSLWRRATRSEPAARADQPDVRSQTCRDVEHALARVAPAVRLLGRLMGRHLHDRHR